MTISGFAETLLYLTVFAFLAIFAEKIKIALKNPPPPDEPQIPKDKNS
jgi:hypothetical protein